MSVDNFLFRGFGSRVGSRMTPETAAKGNKQRELLLTHGVCRALTAMLPMLKVSPCLGVLVTFWQSLPPMTSRG